MDAAPKSPCREFAGAYAAALTPRGRGAVATVAVWGAGALPAVEHYFRPATARPLGDREPKAIVFGRWRASNDNIDAGEDVVVCCKSNRSIEIHCHGGTAAVESILALLQSAGCAIRRWEEWLWAIENDPFRCAARAALSKARTERVAAVFLDQFRGALLAAWRNVVALLDSNDITTAQRQLANLAQASRIGLRLTDPWRVVLAGLPNAGKSTLLNALVGFHRSIAHAEPGTTRDVVTASAAIGGWPVELADTAGLRATDEVVERLGVERARARLDTADVVILVRDAVVDRDSPNSFTIEHAGQLLTVFNKCDLLSSDERRDVQRRHGGLLVSARTGAGIAELIAAVEHIFAPPPAGAAVPFTSGQASAIEEALAAIVAGDRQLAISILRNQLPCP